ncbi:ATP-binding protein [Kocuria sp. M1R5S2]|uniref:ATP-binding protein n=1 Tax=Kocuria rhizosphaerae TaxID=3376285 RepID=UPI0037A38DE4
MINQPLFQTPEATAQEAPAPEAEIIQIDTALESMRDSGFDLTAAVGEPIDNSVEAKASVIRVHTIEGSDKATGGSGKHKTITELAVADDGQGIPPQHMARALSLGYSSRYDQRSGLGRFGVGMKLAGLSLGRRIEVYTKQRHSDQIWHSWIDLDEIAQKTQTTIPRTTVDSWPEAYASMMTDSRGEAVESGTLVVYGKIDRLSSGGTYGTALDEKLNELRTFIARAYRYYLQKGLRIELNGKAITLLDPLFLMDNPRIIKRYKPLDVRGTVVDQAEIEIADGHSIHVTVSLVPAQFRHRSGAGGETDHLKKDIREFQINQANAGKVSMVRNYREINYDIVPRLLPAGIDKIDRYIGIEVRFPADLDEYFQVRNVKRGAVPVAKLREELRRWLDRPVRMARKEIRAHWGETETQDRAENVQDPHSGVTAAVGRVEQTSPPGQAGRDMTEAQTEEVINDILQDLQLTEPGQEEAASRVRELIEEKPITMMDAQWPGSEMFEINHLNGKAVVKLNHRHPLWRDVFDPIKKVTDNGANGTDPEELVALLRKAEAAIELLIMAYAKGENLHKDPSQFDDLRTYWGKFTQSYLKEALPED